MIIKRHVPPDDKRLEQCLSTKLCTHGLSKWFAQLAAINLFMSVTAEPLHQWTLCDHQFLPCGVNFWHSDILISGLPNTPTCG